MTEPLENKEIEAKAIVPEVVNDSTKDAFKGLVIPEPITIVPDQISQNKSPGKTIVKDGLSYKHTTFCHYLVIDGMLPLDAYCKVYTNVKRVNASNSLNKLMSKPHIGNEIQRLRNANSTTKQETIEKLHNKAVETLESIMVNSDKDSVRLGAVNAIINRTVPVINKSMHVGIKVNRTELDRRSNALME